MATFAPALMLTPTVTWAQDMMRHVDLSSPEMTMAEMTRDQVVQSRGRKRVGARISGKRLNGSPVGPRLFWRRSTSGCPPAKLVGTRLRAVLSQAGGADLSGAGPRMLFAGCAAAAARLDGADLSARVAADFPAQVLSAHQSPMASLVSTSEPVDGADALGPALRQPQGRERAWCGLARRPRCLAGRTDLTGASLTSALLGGADLTGAIVRTDFDNADLVSARLIRPVGSCGRISTRQNLERAQRDGERSRSSP
jgi:uncharacterized protein YjbI with pentapeptide repeats